MLQRRRSKPPSRCNLVTATLDPSERIVLVAAVARNGVIGHQGAIPWHLPQDFIHFRQVTDNHTLIMGRATYESIGRPLPGRINIVLTRQPTWSAPGVEVAPNFERALSQARIHGRDIAIIGGAAVYARGLEVATHQILSLVHVSPPGDTFYPRYRETDWVEERRIAGKEFDRVWLRRA